MNTGTIPVHCNRPQPAEPSGATSALHQVAIIDPHPSRCCSALMWRHSVLNSPMPRPRIGVPPQHSVNASCLSPPCAAVIRANALSISQSQH